MTRRLFARRQAETERRILAALDFTDGWAYGLDLMRRCRLRRGRFYPAIDRLVASRLVEARWDPGPADGTDCRRRQYRLNEEPF